MALAKQDRSQTAGMSAPRLERPPVTRTGMLIRKPVAEVFRAFVDPEVTSKFWFTKSTGALEAGRHVKWEWEMYGSSTNVSVKQLDPNKRIVIEWDGYSGRTTVEWKFEPMESETTFVTISESGWNADGDTLVQYVNNATQGRWRGSRRCWSTAF